MAGLPQLVRASGGILATLAGLGGIAYTVNEAVYTVDPGHRAIIFSRLSGINEEILGEGIHFRVPWFQYPRIYDVRAKLHPLTSRTGSKDLQMVDISLAVLYRPSADHLPRIYQNLGMTFDERVLPSIMNEVLKSVVAQFNAAQLISQRAQVSRLIRDNLTQRAREFWIILDEVSITDLSFGPEFTAAIEAKQIAQQTAQRAALIVQKAKQEKQQKIVEAEGEARAAELIGNAVKQNPGFLKLRRIDAAKEIATKMSTSANRVLLDSNQLLLNLGDTDNEKEAANLVGTKKSK